MKKPIRIGIAGTRGIPANYGGFETFAEEISKGLCDLGYEVTVYCEKNAIRQSFLGKVKLKYLPMLKSTNQAIYFFWSFCKAIWENDIVIVTSTGASYIYPLNKVFFRRKVITNTDGVESQRTKWSYWQQKYLLFSEYFAVKWSDIVVADALGIADYLYKHYQKMAPVSIIEYGAHVIEKAGDQYKAYDVDSGNYLLIVARLEPENNILMMLEGYTISDISMPLLVVGYIQHTDYVRKLQEFANNRVRFLNGIYDKDTLNSLRFHAYAYLHGHSVGGTNPSLLEAMGCGSICICNDNIYNREVTNHNMYYFSDALQLAALLNTINTLTREELQYRKALALARVKSYYSWNNMCDKYAKQFARLLGDNRD
jgi:glycosyltransferase involved in cell wall biosynthesis